VKAASAAEERKQITIYHDLKIDIARRKNEIKMNECDMAAQ
jgi:hypothetical protein